MMKINRTPITVYVDFNPHILNYMENAKYRMYKKCCELIDRDQTPYKLQALMREENGIVALLVDII